MTFDPTDDRIDVEIPADERFLRVVRLIVTGYGSAFDITVDQLDDLRIAADEVVCAAMAMSDRTRLHFSLARVDGHVRLEGHAPYRSGEWSEPRFDLARQILSVVAPDHEVAHRDGVIGIAFTSVAGAAG
ncbi:MAG: hypothetical protein AB7Q42_21390 [Acidimicrobiia bacterium]